MNSPQNIISTITISTYDDTILIALSSDMLRQGIINAFENYDKCHLKIALSEYKIKNRLLLIN
jgi:hypothetical protein